MKQIAVSLLFLSVLVGCTASDITGVEVSTRNDGMGGTRQVTIPDDPFFTDFAYPDATIQASQEDASKSIVWLTTADSRDTVKEYYQPKFADGQFQESENMLSFVLRGESGSRRVMVNNKDASTLQIVLQIDQPRQP